MTQRRDDPRIDDLLADKLVRALMRADHVEPEALKSLMNGIAARLAAARKDGAAGRTGPTFARSAFDRLAPSAPRGIPAPCETAFCW